MAETLSKSMALIMIILIAALLRQRGLFSGEEDFDTLSKIVLNISLPSSIFIKLLEDEFDFSLLYLAVFSFLGNWVFLLIAYFMGKTKEEKSFLMINMSGFNIGNFAMPFISYFFSGRPIMAMTIFDMGNAPMVLGGNYACALAIKGGRENFSLRDSLKKIFSSPVIIVYILVMIISIFSIEVPTFLLDLVGIPASANVFLSMFLLGLALNLKMDRKYIKKLLEILSVRYLAALIMTLFAIKVLPIEGEVMKTIILLIFSPVSSLAPIYTRMIGGDLEFSAAINSLSIVISVTIISLGIVFI